VIATPMVHTDGRQTAVQPVATTAMLVARQQTRQLLLPADAFQRASDRFARGNYRTRPCLQQHAAPTTGRGGALPARSPVPRAQFGLAAPCASIAKIQVATGVRRCAGWQAAVSENSAPGLWRQRCSELEIRPAIALSLAALQAIGSERGGCRGRCAGVGSRPSPWGTSCALARGPGDLRLGRL
jgi:hypothetical protein